MIKIDIMRRGAVEDAECIVHVKASASQGVVSVDVCDVDYDGLQRGAAYLAMSPAEARKLAQRLAEAADNAERAGR